MARFFRRRKFCKFTAEGIKHIDYKDLEILKEYISETGKDEKVFSIIKFKSMTDKKDKNGKLLPDSDRVTK